MARWRCRLCGTRQSRSFSQESGATWARMTSEGWSTISRTAVSVCASAVSGLFAALASLRRVEEAAEAGDAGLVAGRVRMCRTGPSSGLVRQCVYDGCA
jgi:hypothetical protein